MDMRYNGGDYGPGGGGRRRSGGNHSFYDRPNQEDGGDGGADGGRWQNDMYDSHAQQPRRSHGGGGGDRERGSYQHDHRDQRGEGGRARSRGYGGGGGAGDRYGSGGGRRDSRGGTGGGYRERNQDNTHNNWPTPGGAGAGGEQASVGDVGFGEGGESGSERWQKHAQMMSAKSGGGHLQRPEVSGEREQGRVCSLKDSFGFVRCMDRPGDLFFHLTEAPPNINVGDEVDFLVGMGNRSGKDCALKLTLLPPGTVSSEVVLDASFLGVIERDIRSYPSMPSAHRANMMGRSRPQDFQQAEGLIKITGAAPPEETPDAAAGSTAEERKEQGADDSKAREAGDEAQTCPENETAGVAVTAAPLGLQGAMVSYLVADALDEDAGSKFRRGDEVRFKVSQEKASGRKRAVEVVLVRTNRERREEEQLKKLIDSGATKQQGVVKKMSHDYGFLQALSCPGTVYFNTAHVVQTREGEHPRVGSHAEFWVVPDRTKGQREGLRALEVKILPPGTLTLEEETHKKIEGTVERAPTLPQRQSFGGGREGGGGGGGTQPGSARFSIPAATAEVSPRGEEASVSTSVVASLNLKELGKSQVPTLEVDDVIEADLWKSNLGKGTIQAKNIKLLRFGGERVPGVVKSLRDGGFGFIRPLGMTEDVYFRINDTFKGLPELSEGSEVMFTQHESEKGGEKKRATRVEVCPKGTLKVEICLASGVNGVVTRDAKGSGQGMITITDGHNLDMPAEFKFPKIAARIRELAQSGERELVFEGKLSAGERNAAHSLAMAEGLGCETRGDEGKRALYVWKPESEQEAASIKEAEQKRSEERSKELKERSKNGERSLSVPFTREDTVSTKPGEKAHEKVTDGEKVEDGVAKGQGNNLPGKPSKSKLTQDFRTEKGFAAYAAAAQRGDLVTFDVVLNRGSMKRRAANVKVVKRAAAQSSNAKGNAASVPADGGVVQEDGNGQDKEFTGVVSLVQLERHYGFIEVLDIDERVFFHLSDVLPDEICANDAAKILPEADVATAINVDSSNNVSASVSNTGSANKPIIRRGQEVAFCVGQRQGKPLGLRVRKLRPGTLPTEETLPCRFVGVVVVPPRNIGTDKEKDPMASAADMEGMLVVLHAQNAAPGGEYSSPATAEQSPLTPPQAKGSSQERDEASAEEHSALEAEKEASKAQRMLSLAGIRVSSSPQDAASSLSGSGTQHQQPSTTSSLLLNLDGVSPAKRRSSRARGGAASASRGPPRFTVLRFLASTDANRAVPVTEEGADETPATVPRDVPPMEAVAEGRAPSYGRGDLVDFSVVARRGQRQQSLRVGDVSLLSKAALPCRRGKVNQVDTKAGIAHVDLLQDQSRPDKAEETGGTAVASSTTRDSAAGGEGVLTTPQPEAVSSSSTSGADNGPAFFLLKEMVGAAGPLRDGDEVDLMLPAPIPGASQHKYKGVNLSGGGHAVGAVRVQDLKSLSVARQRLNINLRDSQKGPQVRMAQGPDGDGFKQGHRASASLYADKQNAEPTVAHTTTSEERVSGGDGTTPT